ncbi:hypothetical protein A4S06_05435 [Erysipelotrichaceae bacterium MTC7]|nr:hypothetical protein A4S06_05435 [Erysipelotrichaceae bacterium MTC7]
MKSNIGLAAFARKKAAQPNTIYVLGSFGQVLTSSFLEQKCKQLPWNQQNRGFLSKYVDQGIQAYDCCGLIKAYLWDDKPSNYKASEDENEAMMYDRAKVKGSIHTLPEREGMLVFMPGHVGVYIGNGEVVECTPNMALGGWGVLKTKLAGRGWTHWAAYARIANEVTDAPSSSPAEVETKPDQVLVAGSSLVSIPGVFRADYSSASRDAVSNNILANGYPSNENWIPGFECTETDANGNVSGDQNIHLGEFFKVNGTYKVKKLHLPTEAALITMRTNAGKNVDVWLRYGPMYEVKD